MARTPKGTHIIIIGGGPQGLATGIELLEAGYQVTIVEAQRELGQGISYRPDFNQWGIVHSGAYYSKGSKRGDMCLTMYDALENPGTLHQSNQDSTVMRIFRENTRETGKLIIARSDAAMEKLITFAERLAGSRVKHTLLTNPEDIVALNEPSMGTPKAVLNLSNGRVIHIKRYIDDLQKEFERQGGQLLTSYEATGFETPTIDHGDMPGTGVICQTPSGRQTLRADAVVNIAGQYAGSVAGHAAEALNKSIADGQATTPPPATLEERYCQYGVLVAKNPAIDKDTPLTRRVIYVADSAVLDGPKSTVGPHSFVSAEAGDGLYTLTIGPFIHHGIPADRRAEKFLPSKEITEEMWKAAEAVVPNLPRDKFTYRHLGRITNYLDGNGQRVFSNTLCQDDRTGFCVLNSFTSDAPGLTCSPVIARDTAWQISENLGIMSPSQMRAPKSINPYYPR